MKVSHRLIVSSTAVLAALTVCVQGRTIADSLNDNGNISVVQPEALNNRLKVPVHQIDDEQSGEADLTETVAPKIRAGYRVQVFDDNNVRSARGDAQSRKHQIETRFPEFPVYVTFSSPYWRVKVGDFKTRGEAEAAMAEIRHAFPAMAKSLRIVRDRINQH